MRHRIVTAILVLSAAACAEEAELDLSEMEEALTAPWSGAVAKPASWTIVPPWANGVQHTLAQTYGTNMHQHTNRTSGSNDHHALDIDLVLNEAVYPIASGTVVYAGPATGGYSSYGNIVYIKHVVGGVNYQSLYAHLNSVAVSAGASVSTSTLIGRAGNSGLNGGWVHLHLAIYKQASFQTSGSIGPYAGQSVVPEKFSSCTKNGASCENFAVGNVLKKVALPPCGSGLYCATNSITGASQCMSGSQPLFCCPSGQTIVNGVCTSNTVPNCGSGLYCSGGPMSGASLCRNSAQQNIYCCALGYTILNNACYASTVPNCGSGLYCAGNQIPGSSLCRSGTSNIYCCALGYRIANGTCTY